MAGLAEALRDIHRVGVVHRDLKPSNVLLADGRPEGHRLRHLPADGQRTAHRDGQVDRHAAVHGARAVPAAAGGGPGGRRVRAGVGAGARGDRARAVRLRQPVRRRVPGGARRAGSDGGAGRTSLPLVARCLAKDPADRPTPDELMRELRAVRGPQPPEARGPPPVASRRSGPRSRRRRAAPAPVVASGPEPAPEPTVASEPGGPSRRRRRPAPRARGVRGGGSGGARRAASCWSRARPSGCAGCTAAVRGGAASGRQRRDRRRVAAVGSGSCAPARPAAAAKGARPASCSYGGGALYCAARGVRRRRLDPADGRVLWSHPAATSRPGESAPAAPVPAGGLVQVCRRTGPGWRRSIRRTGTGPLAAATCPRTAAASTRRATPCCWSRRTARSPAVDGATSRRALEPSAARARGAELLQFRRRPHRVRPRPPPPDGGRTQVTAVDPATR